MRRKHLYIALAVLGAVLPYSQFVPWVAANGLNVRLLVQEIVSSRIAAFGWLDVLVSGITLISFIRTDGRETRTPRLWIPILGTLTVGVSLGFPLYLAMREGARSR